MAQEISYISLFYFFLTVIPIFLIMRHLRIDLIKKTGTALGRMAGQLVLVGLYLQYIFNLNNWMINLGYITLMTLIAVWTIGEEIRFREWKLNLILFISIAVPIVLNLSLFNILILKLKNGFDAMYLIPITGMILGNSMNGVIVALGDFVKTFRKNQDEYLFALALGATKGEAIKPYIAGAISLSLKPNIAMMANVGVVSLPGMMTGQILGGSLPILAIKYQIAIMLGIFTARFFSTYIIMELISRFYFDKFSILDERF